MTNFSSYIIIRADGSKKIGYGHLKRSQIISEKLFESKGIKSILVSKINKENEKVFNTKILKLISIDNNTSIDMEIEIFNEINKKHQPLFIILDILENDININYTRGLKNLNIPIVAITDDSNRREIDVSLVINGNPNQLNIKYKNNSKYLLGPKYFIMDPSYEFSKAKRPLEDFNKHVLISLGGSDHNNIVFKTIEAISLIKEISEITLISSEATEYSKKLIYFIKTIKKKINLLFDVPSLAPFFISSNFAITAGGNTLFERIATRLPGATICQLQRQMEIADKFDELGVNINFGYGPKLTVEEIYTKTRHFIKNHRLQILQNDLSRKIIDGKGLNRVVNKIGQIINLG